MVTFLDINKIGIYKIKAQIELVKIKSFLYKIKSYDTITLLTLLDGFKLILKKVFYGKRYHQRVRLL